MSPHAREVRDLWAAYGRAENTRVPITFACDEQVWLKVSGHSFREFYTVPAVHMKAQLEGRRWFCENVIGDMKPGFPDTWPISVQAWMEENEFFGGEAVYQEDDYAWAPPLSLDREALLKHIADIDPEARIRQGWAFKLYQALKGLADGARFLGRPIWVAPPGSTTHGLFTKAAEIRGLDQICLDLCDAPDFARKLLDLVTEKTIARIQAWHKLTGRDTAFPSERGFGLADDSLQLISAGMYEEFVLPCHERLYAAMTRARRNMHLCGRSSQHYEVLRRKLNVTTIDGPGPFVDHGYYLRKLGPDFSLHAQTDNAVLANGPVDDIDAMLRGLLTPAAKLSGRFQIMGFVTRDTPLRNIRACYEAGRKYGVIRRQQTGRPGLAS